MLGIIDKITRPPQGVKYHPYHLGYCGSERERIWREKKRGGGGGDFFFWSLAKILMIWLVCSYG